MKSLKVKLALFAMTAVLLQFNFGRCIGDLIGDTIVLRAVD